MVFFFLTFFPCLGLTQIPQKINYQGYLTDASGVPINGTIQMTFSIYDVSTGGDALWSETQNVVVNHGVYSVNLGDFNPLRLPFDIPYYLGVRVGSDPEMVPRRELNSVGYAFRAKTVETIGSHTHSASDITSGILDVMLFSAYSDLGREGYLDNDEDTDLLTRLQADGRYVNEGQANSVSSAMIADGQVGASDINSSEVQRRVTGTCLPGSSIQAINQDGSVTCEADDNSGGTVTQVNTGTGLTGGPITTTGTISLSSTYQDGSAYDGRFVNVTGDTMTGPLSVAGDISTSGVYKLGNIPVLSAPNNNTFLGRNAGYSNTTGYYNTFLGAKAGLSNTTGSENTFIGREAGLSNTTGSENTFIGREAGLSNTTANYNTFLGAFAGYENTEGWANTFIGSGAGSSNTTGNFNTFLGDSAGRLNRGNGNTFLGYYAGGWSNITVNNNVFIGYQAGFYEAGSNKLYIANSGTSSPLIYGDFSLNSVKINGSFSVTGTKSFIQPHAKDPTKEIVYIATEAPEAVVMYRGSGQLKEGMAVIELPEHFSVVAAENGIQVQVTPTEDCSGIFVKSKSKERIEVKELMKGKSDAKFDYIVTAVRAGFEKHEPVVENTSFKPKENETVSAFEARFSGDDMNTRAMKEMLISNGILTKDGELNMKLVKKLGWVVKEAELAKGEE